MTLEQTAANDKLFEATRAAVLDLGRNQSPVKLIEIAEKLRAACDEVIERMDAIGASKTPTHGRG